MSPFRPMAILVRVKRNEELVVERMKRLEERLKESEDREISARESLERVEDRLKGNEEEKGQDKV